MRELYHCLVDKEEGMDDSETERGIEGSSEELQKVRRDGW